MVAIQQIGSAKNRGRTEGKSENRVGKTTGNRRWNSRLDSDQKSRNAATKRSGSGDLSGLGPDATMIQDRRTTTTLAPAIRIGNPGHETSFSPRSIELDELLENSSSLIHPDSSALSGHLEMERRNSKVEPVFSWPCLSQSKRNS